MKPRNTMISNEQKRIFFETMSKKRSKRILSSRASDGGNNKCLKEEFWKDLVVELNCNGPRKGIAQWKKCWTDLRLNMRKKYFKAKVNKYVLSDYEKEVIISCQMINEKDIQSKSNYDISDLSSNDSMNRSNTENFYQSSDQDSKDCYVTNIKPQTEITYDVQEPQEVITCDELYEANTNHSEESRYQEETQHVAIANADTFEIYEVASSERSNRSHSPKNVSLRVTSPRSTLPSPRLQSANGASPRDTKDAVVLEVEKMHRNLLKESRKQTEILSQILRALQQPRL